MYETLVENYISRDGSMLKCQLCCNTISLNEEAITEHILEPFHKELVFEHREKPLNKEKNVSCLPQSEEDYKILVENNVVLENTFYYCYFCLCKLLTFKSILAHIKGNAHQAFYSTFNKPQFFEKECCSALNNEKEGENLILDNVKLLDSKPSLMKKYYSTKIYTIMVDNCLSRNGENYNCYFCRFDKLTNFESVVEHIHSPFHLQISRKYRRDQTKIDKNKENLEDAEEALSKAIVDNNIIYKGFNYFCLFCKAKPSLNNLYDHINSIKHQNFYSIQNMPYVVGDDLTIIRISNENEIKEKENAKPCNVINPVIKNMKDLRETYSNENKKKGKKNAELCNVISPVEKNTKDPRITYRFLVQNYLTCIGTKYRCYFCKCIVNSNYEAILEHVNTQRHQDFYNLYAWDKVKPNKVLVSVLLKTEEDYKVFVDNYIVFKELTFFCYCCQARLNIDNIDSHLYTKKHIVQCISYDKEYQQTISCTIEKHKNIKNPNEEKPTVEQPVPDQETYKVSDSNPKKEKSTEEQLVLGKEKDKVSSNTIIANDLSFLNQLQHLELKKNKIIFEKIKEAYECQLCQIHVSDLIKAYEHTIDEVHRQNYKQSSIKVDKLESMLSTINNPDLFYHCKRCNIYLSISEKLIQTHCAIHFHEDYPNLNQDIIQFDISQGKCISMQCVICQVTMKCEKTLAEHLGSIKHHQKYAFISCLLKRNFKINFIKIKKPKVGSPNSDLFKPMDDISFKSFCKICYQPVIYNDKDQLQIIKPEKNVLLQLQPHEHQQDPLIINFQNNIPFYKCLLCNDSVSNSNSLLDHYKNHKMHRKFLNQLYSLLNDQNIKNIFHLSYIEIQNLLSSTEKTYRNIREKIISIFKPPTHEVKKSRKHLIDNERMTIFIDKYVEMCISSGQENIYTIDPDLIKRNNLSISLTYLVQNQRVCLACSFLFPDDFMSLYEHLLHQTHNDNLCSLIEEDNEKETDSLSYLDLAKSCMQETSQEIIKCYACNKEIENYDDDIEAHIESSIHKNKINFWKRNIKETMNIFEKLFQDSWYYIERYFCQVCNITFNHEMIFAEHLVEFEHFQKAKANKSETKVNICHVCRLCWYGKPDYKKHFESDIHNLSLNKKRYNFIPFLKKSKDLLCSAESNIQTLLRESDKVIYSMIERKKEKQLIESIEELAQHYYPLAKAYPFGSRSCHLGFPTSDVDVFLDCENIYENIGSRLKSKEYINLLRHDFFSANMKIWKRDCVLLEARVPIMKLIHKPTNLKCDISFLSGLGVEKSNLIKNYVLSIIECRKLILFLKKWFMLSDIYGPQGINAYAISWYAIFYLQLQEIVPSVFELIAMKNKSKLVDGWQCGFLESVPVNQNTCTFESLLKGFFSYYAEFDFQADVVCPFLGRVLKKANFKNIDNYPEEMKIYKDRLISKEVETIEVFRFESPMCIQDPVDLSQNITKAVNKANLRCFKNYCYDSFKIISS